MKALVRALFGRRRTDCVVECRRCGTTLSRDATTCPECGSTSIVIHEIS